MSPELFDSRAEALSAKRWEQGYGDKNGTGDIRSFWEDVTKAAGPILLKTRLCNKNDGVVELFSRFRRGIANQGFIQIQKFFRRCISNHK